ncbi:hypothetical protein SAMN04488057_1264 [Cyclobacterium lianum]|uniref:DUF2059 domain-containing protein n=1 Tax=Cyclobacterium lianum TaxID=388280 RepID=A0A1M7QU45_9BACT|nr:DUF2059 domain-containing protein [Cyclobacterium lianum]SHN35327.1 hypothetical protein SAMN04488057_1264 [Cyclobacterium lianum]
MQKIILIFAFSVWLHGFSFGQKGDDYAKTLKEMFEVSGTEESYQAVIKQMFGMFKQQSADVDPGIWKSLEQEFSSTSIDELVKMQVPVYQKYLSIGDLEEMIKFYKTPVGQKFAKSTPMIMQESMEIGQQWGMKLGEEISRKMKEKGILL